ncbi:MAG: DUF2723 domain-containing protein [Gemmatimonadota bacterium]
MPPSSIQRDAPSVGARTARVAGLIAVIATTGAVFWRTAYPTITWWDSSSYSLAAATLGITNGPGSLLLTLLGWPITRLAQSSAIAHALNLFAGLIAAGTAAILYLAACRLRAISDPDTRHPRAVAIGATVGAIGFALSASIWEYAVTFTPYILTVFFTALILLTLLTWWAVADTTGSWRWLFVLGLLVGLDFSVHRTNALLLPGALVWISLRHPRTLARWRTWLLGGGGMVLGLTVQLLIIPISRATTSPLNMGNPDTLARWWDYVTLQQLGGHFLLNLWPRNSPLWSNQVADVVRMLGDSLFRTGTHGGFLGLFSLAMVVVGLVALARRRGRLALAVVAVLVLQAVCTVLYFNIPEAYFRSLDRHYLPLLVTLGLLMAYGCVTVAVCMSSCLAAKRWIPAVSGAVALAAVPLLQAVGNAKASDASDRYFTWDYAHNALSSLPPNAIYFTMGDNDTFPLWYLQAVEHERPDVLLINISMTNAAYYLKQLIRDDPKAPLTLSPEQRTEMTSREWTDSVQIGPMSARLQPMFTGTTLLQDVVRLEILRANNWVRPVTLSVTVGEGGLGWLAPFARLDGLHWTVVPAGDPAPDPELLRANLTRNFRYRGLGDTRAPLDRTTRFMGGVYYPAILSLIAATRARDGDVACRRQLEWFTTTLPPDELTLTDEVREALKRACAG